MKGGSHPARVSRGTPGAQAGGLRGKGEGVRGCRGGARARGGGSLAPALPGGSGGTQAGEPETTSQFIYQPVPAALPPAAARAAAASLLRSHRPLPAAPASARTAARSQERRGPSAPRLLHASRGGAASSRPAGAPPSRSPHSCAPRGPERLGGRSGRRAAGLSVLPWALGFPRQRRGAGQTGGSRAWGLPLLRHRTQLYAFCHLPARYLL